MALDALSMARIRLKALVDKENNRVILAESNEDFVDVLFSFLTIPIGTIIKFCHYRPPAASLGCMNNLYKSVKNLEEERFQTRGCREMLLSPQNAAAANCQNLKLNLYDTVFLEYFHCGESCSSSNYKLVSHYRDALCDCKCRTRYWITCVTRKDSDAEVGVFVKGLARLMVSDDLQVVPSSTAASFSMLSKLGIIDGSATETRSFNIGLDEVFELLQCSLVSNTPLTEVLLRKSPILGEPGVDRKNFEQWSSKKRKREASSNHNGKIVVRLMVSKSHQIVCYAEASEDFVDLLFSFLTVPLGFIIKQMHGGNYKGYINRLYDSVQGLDAEQYLKSQENKEMLLSPKLAPCFSYENQLLGIEEYKPAYYYCIESESMFLDKTLLPSDSSDETVSPVIFLDPKSDEYFHYKDRRSVGGFMEGPVLFTITDDLTVTASSISGIIALKDLKVPFDDIEERTVHVGENEALRLLVASFITKSALTNAFLLK